MKQISLYLLVSFSMAFSQAGLDSTRTCMNCHTPGNWLPLSASPVFDHDQDTPFVLAYTHADLTCTQCHSGASLDEFHKFQTKGDRCIDCHQDIHQNYWGNGCQECHSPENWDPAQAFRRHDQTLFPLAAAHHSLDCYFCHTRPGMTPSLYCEDCHAVDFLSELAAHDGLTNQADCSTCHAPTRWDQILAINHGIFFPIYSGEHRGRWNNCSTCHIQAGDYQTFTCFGSGCHSVSDMNAEHCEDGSCERCDGLTYPRTGVIPQDCLSCHPNGNNSKCGD